MKRLVLIALLMTGCSTAPKYRMIDSRSYQLGCLIGVLSHRPRLSDADAKRIKDFCQAAEEETRKGVGEPQKEDARLNRSFKNI